MQLQFACPKDSAGEDSDFEENEASPATAPPKGSKGKGTNKPAAAKSSKAAASASKPKGGAGNKKKRHRSSSTSSAGAKNADKSAGGGGGPGGGGGGGVSAKPAWMRQRWVQVGKTDEEANVPVAPSPVTDAEFDEMVRSCVRNDAMEKVKAKRAALAKRLQVCVNAPQKGEGGGVAWVDVAYIRRPILFARYLCGKLCLLYVFLWHTAVHRPLYHIVDRSGIQTWWLDLIVLCDYGIVLGWVGVSIGVAIWYRSRLC